MEIEKSIAALEEVLSADERITAAILFGSAAKGMARRSSDLDVGLIASGAQATRSLEAGHLELVGRLSAAANRDVQVVLLDRVEPVLGRQAFLGSRTLFDRDPGRTADVLERILTEYFDGEYHRRLRSEALDQRRAARRG